jgi:ribonuclease HII
MVKKNKKNAFPPHLFEKNAWATNNVVIGIDEVGRGCLAGPLVTAAVILPLYSTKHFLKDSKIMTLEQRIKAFSWLSNHASYGIGIINNRLIDKHNIWQATLIGMKKALVHLFAQHQDIYKPSAILVDAMPLSIADTCYNDIPVYHFPFGESHSRSIAAASIIAKVTRDRLMEKMALLLPGYHLERHKGYATPSHRKAVIEQLQSIIHRESFLHSVLKGDDNDTSGQQTLC